MPYIEQKDRDNCDQVVSAMEEGNLQINGDLNYILYAYCLRTIKPSYNGYKNFLGELNETCEEIRRRLLAPYEDEKILLNGDVE